MHVIYGINGVGMGHAVRGKVVLDHLRRRGHTVTVTSFGRGAAWLREAYAADPFVDVIDVVGLEAVHRDGEVRRFRTLIDNLARLPAMLVRNGPIVSHLVDRKPDVAICDFESTAWWVGRLAGAPVISLDNQGLMPRCQLDPAILPPSLGALGVAAGIGAKIPFAYHYLVTTVAPAEVKRARTTLVPPILRRAILDARREPGEHVLVYHSTADEGLFRGLEGLPWTFRIYGTDEVGTRGNLTFCAFDEDGFVDDLRTARAAVASAGHSFLGEALHLGVPLLAIPLRHQTEQRLNAAVLAHHGWGAAADTLTAEAVADFLAELPRYERALARYPRRDNRMLFACLDELLRDVAACAPRSAVLAAPSIGDMLGAAA